MRALRASDDSAGDYELVPLGRDYEPAPLGGLGFGRRARVMHHKVDHGLSDPARRRNRAPSSGMEPGSTTANPRVCSQAPMTSVLSEVRGGRTRSPAVVVVHPVVSVLPTCRREAMTKPRAMRSAGLGTTWPNGLFGCHLHCNGAHFVSNVGRGRDQLVVVLA